MTDDASALSRQVDEVDREEEQEEPSNFAEHRRTAVEEYLRVRPRYEAFARAVREILVQALTRIHRWTRTEGVRTLEGGVRKLQTRWPGLEFG